MIKTLLAFVLFCLSPAFAANHYVWCGASGTATGADFTNAYTDLPAGLTRGDTYYIAGSNSCTYAKHNFNDVVSGTTQIFITKATVATNSGVAGWQASFASSTALWNVAGTDCYVWSWASGANYYTLDGITYTAGTTNTAGFVLRSDNGTTTTQSNCFSHVTFNSTISNIIINNAEIDGINCCDVVSGNGIAAVFFVGVGTCDSITLHNIYVHNIKGDPFHVSCATTTNITFDHTWAAVNFYDVQGGFNIHAQGIYVLPSDTYSVNNMTFSYDIWEDIVGTGTIVLANGTISNVLIYGNVFFENSNKAYTGGGLFTTPSWYTTCGICDLGGTAATLTNIKVYNNTFYNISTAATIGVQLTTAGSSGIDIKNNLFYNTPNVALLPDTAHDYNTIINGFKQSSVTAAAHDFFSTMTAVQAISQSGTTVSIQANGHGLVNGDPVVLLFGQVSSSENCSVDTQPPYPTVTVVDVNNFTFTATNSQTITCQANVGDIAKASANPFTSVSGKNFQLISESVLTHLNDGVSLASPYNLDILGLTRGVDGTWDRGTYEFVLGVVPVSAPALGMFGD